MPITEPEWTSLANMVEKIVRRVAGTKADMFVTGKVIRVDAPNKCVYLSEFGDQPIPIVGFNYDITYYNDNGSTTTKKTTTATPSMPKVGDNVLVAREMGTRRLPRCLGVILGKNWIVAEDD